MIYFRWYVRLSQRLKSIKLNDRRTNLYQTISLFVDNISQNQLFNKANGVAFSFTLAIFPAIIFIFTLIPYIHEFFPRMHAEAIIEFLSTVMPDTMWVAAKETITDIVSIKREGLLSFGALFALLLATNGMNGLMSAFNSIYKTNDKRGFIRSRFVATAMTLILSFVLFLAIFLLVAGKAFIMQLHDKQYITGHFILTLVFVLKYTVIINAFFGAISLIYYFAPAIHDRWTFFSAGAIFSSLGCVLVSFAFSFYINNFGSYNKFYGSLGMLIALMIWFYLLSLILLTGFVYNASVDQAIASNKIEKTTSVFE